MILRKIPEGGFTLVEVLASLAIISTLVIAFMNIYVSANQKAVNNNNKLVAVHLAKGMLERVKLDSSTYIKEPLSQCPEKDSDGGCLFRTGYRINGNNYEVRIKYSQTEEEKKMGLVNVVVEAKLDKGSSSISSKVEGYVKYGDNAK